MTDPVKEILMQGATEMLAILEDKGVLVIDRENQAIRPGQPIGREVIEAEMHRRGLK